jgi:hypothetical protein
MSTLKLSAKRLRQLYKEGKQIGNLEVQHASDALFLSIYCDSPPGNCLICWFCYPDFRPERKSSRYCDRVKMPVRVADGIPEWCPLRKENKNAESD